MEPMLLTIGRFARLCRLSVKQLRHYDETDLLTPAYVDPHTGYRHYTRAQATRALTIALLRDADVPLSAIAEIVAADDDARPGLFKRERDRLAAKLARDRERLRILDRLAAGEHAAYDITLAEEPARSLAVVEGTCDVADIGKHTGELIARLFATVPTWEPPVWGLFPVDITDGMRIGMGVSASKPTRELPPTTVVTTTHHGAYAELPIAYHALLGWIHDRDLHPEGPIREAYLVGPGAAAPDELVTRIAIPVLTKESR